MKMVKRKNVFSCLLGNNWGKNSEQLEFFYVLDLRILIIN